MTDLFQIISAKIATFITVVVITVTSILPWSATDTNKPVDTSTATPSATVSESVTPSATPTPTPSVTSKSKRPIPVQKEIEPTPTIIPFTAPQNPIQYPQTYRTLTLPELVSLNGANTQAITAAQSAYNIFVRTPNLIYMSPTEQSNLYKPILEAEIKRVLDEYKEHLQNQIDWYDQQLSPTPPPVQYYNNSQSNLTYQTCVNNKVATIKNNPYLSESSMLSQIEKAKQDCLSQ